MSTDTTTRWTVTVTKETDAALRAYLGAQGMRKGDISKFIEEAVRWRMFDQSVQQVKARHADRSADELQAIIDEACAAVRAATPGGD
ncbi:MAG: ribbon-helix-helix domain-containing protein [Burkholderiaceae bacterium]